VRDGPLYSHVVPPPCCLTLGSRTSFGVLGGCHDSQIFLFRVSRLSAESIMGYGVQSSGVVPFIVVSLFSLSVMLPAGFSLRQSPFFFPRRRCFLASHRGFFFVRPPSLLVGELSPSRSSLIAFPPAALVGFPLLPPEEPVRDSRFFLSPRATSPSGDFTRKNDLSTSGISFLVGDLLPLFGLLTRYDKLKNQLSVFFLF